jgi:hypothetical protein
MAAIPAMSVPTISPGEMQLLLSRTGLMLNPGQVADLVLAWRQVAALIASIPHDRPLSDDMALTFRLPPPAEGAATASAHAGSPPTAKSGTAAKAKPPVKAKAKAKAKSAKRRAPPPPPRKGARRGR